MGSKAVREGAQWFWGALHHSLSPTSHVFFSQSRDWIWLYFVNWSTKVFSLGDKNYQVFWETIPLGSILNLIYWLYKQPYYLKNVTKDLLYFSGSKENHEKAHPLLVKIWHYFMTALVPTDQSALSACPWTDRSFLRREIMHSWLEGISTAFSQGFFFKYWFLVISLRFSSTILQWGPYFFQRNQGMDWREGTEWTTALKDYVLLTFWISCLRLPYCNLLIYWNFSERKFVFLHDKIHYVNIWFNSQCFYKPKL